MNSSERYCSSCGAANPPEATLCFACGLSLKITAPLSLETTSSNNQYLLQQRYRILAQVGKGGFSAVYKAVDTRFDDHPVAIKAITLSGLKPQEVIEATEAFNREMMVLSGLKHPNLPRIYNHFSDVESWYLVMDFIEGTTLERHLERMRDGCLPIGEVMEIGLLLCSVLEYLHTRQPPVIFRDLKPANVMLTTSGRIALIDFGIARHFKPGQAKDTMPFGSPGYAAPEQYGKAQTTTRTDIYGLGVMLHQLLTGDDPSQSPFRFAQLHLLDQPVLAELETLIMQMVEMDATKRPESIVVVKQELQRIASAWSRQHVYGLQARGGYQPPEARPVSWQTIVPPVGGTAQGMGTGPGASQPVGGGRTGQMIVLQQHARGMGGSYGSPSPTGPMYWARGVPQKRRNKMAIASLVFGFISILIPLASCSLSFAIASHVGPEGSHLTYILPAVTLLVPSILAVVFGHIGKHRANTIPGMWTSEGTAIAGLVLGYLLGSIYLAVLCLFFAFI
jgi:hypothetical protein